MQSEACKKEREGFIMDKTKIITEADKDFDKYNKFFEKVENTTFSKEFLGEGVVLLICPKSFNETPSITVKAGVLSGFRLSKMDSGRFKFEIELDNENGSETVSVTGDFIEEGMCNIDDSMYILATDNGVLYIKRGRLEKNYVPERFETIMIKRKDGE